MFFFADAPTLTDVIGSILQTGAIGGVLIWFMFRNEKGNKMMADAVDRSTRASLLLVITFGAPAAKQLAESITKEIDEAKARRDT